MLSFNVKELWIWLRLIGKATLRTAMCDARRARRLDFQIIKLVEISTHVQTVLLLFLLNHLYENDTVMSVIYEDFSLSYKSHCIFSSTYFPFTYIYYINLFYVFI